MRQILDGRGRQAAAPEEGVDLAVLQRVRRLGGAEPLPTHLAIGIEAGGCEEPHRGDLGAAARRAGRQCVAAQVADLPDVGTGERHDVRVVGVEHGEADGRDGAPVERAATRDRVGQRVGQRERDVGSPVANQFEVVDGGGRHFSRRADIGQLLVEDLRESAAVRVVDAAGAARRDGNESARRPRVAFPTSNQRREQERKRERAATCRHAGILLGCNA